MVNRFALLPMLVSAVMLVAGCGVSGDPQRMISRAKEHREKSDFKAAIIDLKNVIQKEANNAEARYLLGITYYDSKDYRLAEQELRRALDLSYERSKVMPALGKSMLMLGEHQKVLDQIPVEAHASNAVQADVLTLRARALIGLKRSSQSVELLNAALVKQPEFPDALLGLALLAAGERKLDESSRLVERAIASAPKHVDAWLMRGEVARLSGDREKQLMSNQKVLEIDSVNITARLNIASVLILRGKLDEARKLIAQAKSQSPAHVMAQHMQALVEYRARNYKAANDSIQQVLKVAPEFAPSVLLAGAILAELGSYEQAQGYLGNALERAPRNIFARKLLATTLARSGQTERAVEVLQPALKALPDDGELLALAGEIYMQGGDFGKAAQYFGMATKNDPANAAARTKLAISRMETGNTDQAIADLEAAVDSDAEKYQADLVLIVTHMRRGHHDLALKAMESLEKKQPNNPVTYNLKALIFLGKKDIPNTRKNFERALELQPTFLAAAVNLAKLDLEEKNLKGARSRLESFIEKDKKNAQALIALADMGPALGATQAERVNWLEQARKSSPQSVQPYLMLARIYTQSGETLKALEVSQQGQAAIPEDPILLDILGVAQSSAGKHDQAATTFRKLVQLQPNSPVAHYRLAGALERNSDVLGAAESFRRALVLKPDFLDAILSLVALEIRNKRFQEAMSVVRMVQKQNAKSSFGLSLEGDVLLAQGKSVEALKVYENFHSVAKTPSSLVKLHAAYMAAGRADEGDARVAQWLKSSPDDAVTRLYAADIALKRAKYKEAIVHYELLSRMQPDNVQVLNNLSWAYFQLNDARALSIAERAQKLAPDNPVIADTLATQLIAGGKVSAGIELLEKASKLAPNHPAIHFHLAQGWVKSGDKAKARAALERALAIKQQFSERAEATALLKQLGN